MSNKPRISSDETNQILDVNKVTDKVAIIGIRGYYQDSILRIGENDRNVYDDAIVVVSPRRHETFRANTDPSVYRKGIATLQTGVHRYYKGKHRNRYWALRLVGEKAPVARDGETGVKTGIALNIHKGGSRTTGSEGCQTLSPADWDDFIEIVYDEMAFCNQKTIPYVLIDEKDRRRGAFKPQLLALDGKEIDNLLIRFDKKVEPAVSVGTTQTPSPFPAQTPQTSKPVSQPQTFDESPSQPVQSILKAQTEKLTEKVRDQIKLPELTMGGYLTQAQEKVSQVSDVVGTAASAINQYSVIKDALVASGDRNDGKKSLWSTVGQAAYQMVWAVLAFVIGLPREVWLLVAVVAAIVGVMYLYRQNSLGKIRETARLKLVDFADYLK